MSFNYQPQQISQNLWRITCHNLGPMTGPGTNTYVIKKGNACAVIDAGPLDQNHQQAIVDFTGGVNNIKALLVTHMHPDHSPLAVKLQLLSGAPLYGPEPVDDPFQDTSCNPDQRISHNQIINFEGIQVQAIYTPGHVDNHYCFLIRDDNVLLTGDHIMQGSTVVIIPPHGKMKEYIASLQLLKGYDIEMIAPAHGEPITAVEQEVDGIIKHRLEREQKILAALRQIHTSNTADLTTIIYKDIDKSLHVIAELSLLAHLIKLEQENLVKKDNHLWKSL